MARGEEWRIQEQLAALLDRWLDPATTWWTAVDTVCPSAFVGMLRRRRGVKAGTPDVLVFHRGKLIGIEIKTRKGRPSESQEAARERLLAAGADWWLARSSRAGMEALRRAGVAFRTIPAPPGAAVFGLPAAATWEPANLEPWEEPTRECRTVVRRRAPAEPRGIAQYRVLFKAPCLPGDLTAAQLRPSGCEGGAALLPAINRSVGGVASDGLQMGKMDSNAPKLATGNG